MSHLCSRSSSSSRSRSSNAIIRETRDERSCGLLREFGRARREEGSLTLEETSPKIRHTFRAECVSRAHHTLATCKNTRAQTRDASIGQVGAGGLGCEILKNLAHVQRRPRTVSKIGVTERRESVGVQGSARLALASHSPLVIEESERERRTTQAERLHRHSRISRRPACLFHTKF